MEVLVGPGDAKVAKYIEKAASAVRGVPDDVKTVIVEELRWRLEECASFKKKDGMDDGAAWGAAMEWFGDPYRVGQAQAVAWLKANERGTFFIAAITAFVSSIVMGIGASVLLHFTHALARANGTVGLWLIWTIASVVSVLVGVFVAIVAPRAAMWGASVGIVPASIATAIWLWHWDQPISVLFMFLVVSIPSFVVPALCGAAGFRTIRIAWLTRD